MAGNRQKTAAVAEGGRRGRRSGMFEGRDQPRTFRLPEAMWERISRESAKQGVTRSDIVRKVLGEQFMPGQLKLTLPDVEAR